MGGLRVQHSFRPNGLYFALQLALAQQQQHGEGERHKSARPQGGRRNQTLTGGVRGRWRWTSTWRLERVDAGGPHASTRSRAAEFSSLYRFLRLER